MKKQIREKVRLATITLIIFGLLVVAGGCERNEHSISNRVSSVADPIAQASEVFEEYSETKTKVVWVREGDWVSEKGVIKELIREYFGKDSEMAIAIATCESGLDNRAYNRNWSEEEGVYWSTDHGAMQINDYFHAHRGDIENLTVEENIKIAKDIFDESGWNAWSAYKNGCYKKFLVD